MSYDDEGQRTKRPCSGCGSLEFEDRVTDRIEHVPCEVETLCKRCGEAHLFWSYGSYDPSLGFPSVEETEEYEAFLEAEGKARGRPQA